MPPKLARFFAEHQTVRTLECFADYHSLVLDGALGAGMEPVRDRVVLAQAEEAIAEYAASLEMSDLYGEYVISRDGIRTYFVG